MSSATPYNVMPPPNATLLPRGQYIWLSEFPSVESYARSGLEQHVTAKAIQMPLDGASCLRWSYSERCTSTNRAAFSFGHLGNSGRRRRRGRAGPLGGLILVVAWRSVYSY